MGEVLSKIFEEVEQEVAQGSEMAIAIERRVLSSLVEKVSSVMSAKSDPVLRNVQLTVTDFLRVTGVGPEMAVVSETDKVEVVTPGTALLPARRLLAMLAEAREGVVRLMVRGLRARVEVGPSVWDLRLLAPRGFPTIPGAANLIFTKVDRAALLAAFALVRHAAARDTTRPNLTLIHVDKGQATACDMARLQRVRAPDDLSLGLPVKAADELTRLFRNSPDDKICVGETDSRYVFTAGADIFMASKLGLEFPDVDSLFVTPSLAYRDRMTCDCEELMDAVRRVRILADTDTAAVGLRISRDSLEVLARDALNNMARDVIGATWAGPERLVVVNHGYLMDMLSAHQSKIADFRVGPDKMRRSALVLRDDEFGVLGICNQLPAHLLGVT